MSMHCSRRSLPIGACGSDFPFLRAPERIDHGLVLALVEHLIPDPADRRKVLRDTPARLFGPKTTG
jgi:predicted TIM-barrel fold metal-dependent hydrolase